MQHSDQQEINKFNRLAHEWWNPDGQFKTLHQINPVRLQFIINNVNLTNKNIIDIGCGGGILSESMARYQQTKVMGIDLAPQSIEVAKLHLYESQLEIDYQCIDVDSIAQQKAESFDIVLCMEMLEHVTQPEAIIANCAKLLKPSGVAFFSTLNRTFKSYALGILVAEYILKLLPKGTHDYAKLIRPAELRIMLNKHSLNIVDIKGLDYNPINGTAKISHNVDINYMICCRKL